MAEPQPTADAICVPVQPPASALGSLPSVALSSARANRVCQRIGNSLKWLQAKYISPGILTFLVDLKTGAGHRVPLRAWVAPEWRGRPPKDAQKAVMAMAA